MDVIANQIGASIRVQSASSGPPSDFPVGFRVVAKNRNAIEDSKRFTEELTKLLATIPGTAGVTNDIEEIPGEFQFQVRRDRALALGIDPDSVSGLVRSALQGTTAATITRNARDIDIVVTYPETDFISLADVESLPIRTNSECLFRSRILPLWSEIMLSLRFVVLREIFLSRCRVCSHQAGMRRKLPKLF